MLSWCWYTVAEGGVQRQDLVVASPAFTTIAGDTKNLTKATMQSPFQTTISNACV